LGVLGGSGRNINIDIKNLVSNYLPSLSLITPDNFRVADHNAAHPAKIIPDDTPEV